MNNFKVIQEQVAKYLVKAYPIQVSLIMGMLSPCLTIKPSRSRILSSNTSKYGGLPDVPPEFEWPRTKTGFPLTFICQLNLRQVAETKIVSALPKSGMLYFFILTDGINRYPILRDEFKVIYLESELSINAYSGLVDHTIFDEVAIEFQPIFTLPGLGSHYLRENKEMAPIIEDCSIGFNNIFENDDSYNQVMGHLRSIQADLAYIWAKDTLFPEGKYLSDGRQLKIHQLESTLINLLQVDFGNSGNNFSDFGGNGVAYFGIVENELLNKNFDSVFFSIQST